MAVYRVMVTADVAADGSVTFTVDPASIPAPPPPPPSNGFPTGDVPGFKLVKAEDFTKPAALGQFRSVYGSGWAGYDSWEDTSRNLGRPAGRRGKYNSATTVTVKDSILNVHCHVNAAGQPQVFALTPPLAGTSYDQLYGRYAVRFRTQNVVGRGYKVAWLLWPQSNNWADGEIDFPEGDLGGGISGFSHDVTGQPAINAWHVDTGTTMGDWHTLIIEWVPGKLTFRLDDKSWSTTNPKALPTKPLHWVLQTETWLSSTVVPATSAADVQIDWVAAWAYTP